MFRPGVGGNATPRLGGHPSATGSQALLGSTRGGRFGVRWAARPDWGMPAGPPAPPESGGVPSSLQPRVWRGTHCGGLRCCRASTRGTSCLCAPPTFFRPPGPPAPLGPAVIAAVARKEVLPCTQEWQPLCWSGDSDSSDSGGTATWPCCHLATASPAHRGRGSAPLEPASALHRGATMGQDPHPRTRTPPRFGAHRAGLTLLPRWY